jgi:hypothetical protein
MTVLSREQRQALDRDIIALLQKEDDEYEAQINALKARVIELKRQRHELRIKLGLHPVAKIKRKPEYRRM